MGIRTSEILLAVLCTLTFTTHGQNLVWSGDLANGTVVPPRSIVLMTANTRVPAGATVTVGAGAVIKASGNASLTVEGTLLAQGSAAEPIVFTETADDSAGGDTDKNGPTVGYPGRWGRIRFTATSGGSVLQYVEVRYGAAGADAEVTVEGAPVRFDQCTIRHSRADGLRVIGGKPVISNCNFHSSWGSALSMDLASDPVVTSIRVGTNAVNGLSLDGGALPVDAAWDDPDVVYYLRGTVTVPTGRKLSIAAGQVIKMWGQSVVVGGTVVASGTAGAPIVFTSSRDDSAGGDTDNNGPTVGYNGDWGRVDLLNGSVNNDLAYVEFRYGGSASSAEVQMDGAQARFVNCVFRHSRADGLRITGSNPTVLNGNFHDNWGSALSMDLASNPAVQGIQLNRNGDNALAVDAGTLPVDGVWDDPDVVYRLRGDVSVPVGRKLTIAPGQVIKIWGNNVSIAGGLRALGTAAQPIVFTSLRDDAIGGNTNNDGPTTGYNGDWGRVEFTGSAPGGSSQLAHVQFRYGGAGSVAQVVVAGAPVEFTRCEFRYCRTDSLRITASNPLITEGKFYDNWGSAISMDLASNPTVDGIQLGNNQINGLSVDGGTLPGDGFWDDPDVVYHLRGAVTVPVGRVLQVAPGQVIKLWGQTVTIAGTMRAPGTAAEPIVFTSLRDDSIGGDTNNDKTSVGYNGDWGRVEFTSTSSNDDLAHVEFRYGGANSTAQVQVDNASVRFTGCEFRNSRADGLRIIRGSPIVAQCYFHDNWGSALNQDLAANPTVTAPEIRANGVNALSLEGGTLMADAVWDNPDVVYHLKSTVTVPVGRKLTIAPGQVIKLWGQTVSVSGTLQAVGTAARPIVFTSLRDDSIAGDTNKDGPTVGYNGDWGRLEFTSTSVNNNVAHLEFRYGGGSGSSGTVVFSGLQSGLDACLIRQSSTHAVAANNAARVRVTSSVFAQNWGSGLRAESGAIVEAFNNTSYANDRAVWADSATVTLVNNLLTGNRSAGITRSGAAIITAQYNDVNNPSAGNRNYDGLPVLTGQSDNIDAAPLFTDAAGFNFALKPGSPGIDAGLGDGAPPLDFLGQARVDDPQYPNVGAGNPPYVDLGAVELDRWLSQIDAPRMAGQILLGDTLRFTGTGRALDGATRFLWNFGSGQSSALEDPGLVTFRSPGTQVVTFTTISPDGTPDPNPARMELTVVSPPGAVPDLELTKIEPPAQLAVGQPVDIVYYVKNRGAAPIQGKSWVDAVYLSADQYLDANDVRLASQAVNLAIPADGTYSNALHATLSSSQVQAGQLYLIVSVDDEWALLEERQLNNERALPVDLAIPELPAGIPHPAKFTRSGAGHFYRFEVEAGENLRVQLDDLNNQGVNELYLRRGSLPSRDAFDARSEVAAGADQELIIAAPAPGVWYLLAVGAKVPDTGEYTIQMDKATLTLGAVFPNRSGQLDGAPFRIRGAGFVPGTKVTLFASNGASYPAAAVAVESFSELDINLNLAAVAPGNYGLRVEAGGATASITNALTVVAGGQARLETQLIVPEAVGYHQLATLYVEYRNTGTAVMPAPLLAVSGIQNGKQLALLTLDAARVTTGLWVSGLPEGFSHTVHFLASGEIPGWLHPGESGKVPVYYVGWLQPWDLTYPPIEFNLMATTTESVMPIDWQELKATLKPGAISAEAWNVVSANLQAEIGSTWGTLMSALSEDAAALGQIGRRVSDAAALFGFELAQADGAFPFNYLEREVDATAPMPDLPLVFERTFPALISSRFDIGPLGRGWKHCWETSLKVLSDGSITLRTRAGGVQLFQPDLRGGYTSPSADSGKLTKLADGRFRLQEPDGMISSYRSDGRLESLEDINGRRLTLEYTGTQLARLRHFNGSEFQFAYSPGGRLLRLTDERGQVTTFSYDATEEHLLSVRYPLGRTVTYRYGNTGAQNHALLEKQDTGGAAHFYTYDDRGRLTGVRFGAGSPELRLDYGPAGEVSIIAGDVTGKFYFDHEGRLLKTRDANGLVHQVTYDPQGRLVELIDPLGRTSSARYDSRGNLLAVTDVLGQTASYAYDASGRLTAVTDEKGQMIDYEHDARGNLIKVIQPDATAEAYSYNASGRLATWTRPGGAKVNFAYDSAGRVAQVQADDGTQNTFAYDHRGNLTNTTDVTGTTRYTYYPNDLVFRVDLPGGRLLSFTYDSLGRRETMTDQTGFKIQYQYDNAGRLQRLADGQGNSIVEYHYDGTGRLERVDKGNGTFTTYTYGASGRLVGITNGAPGGQALSRFNWIHNDFGWVTSMETHQGTWNYEYDALGQLTVARFASSSPGLPDQDLKFEYDAAGNRIRTVVQGAATVYTSNPLNQYLQAGEARMTYDAQGGLATRMEGANTWRYFYDALGRVSRVETPEATWRYQYDALGNRAALFRGDQKQEFVYDPLSRGNLVGEYGPSGALQAHYTYGLGLVGRFDAAGAGQFYDFDQLGSTAGMTDAAGAYANEYAFSPFGDPIARREPVPNPFQYVGQFGVTSDGSGLYHMQARDYLPGVGRFLSRDPLGQKAGLNLYTYAGNNPVSMIDPTGKDDGFPGIGVFRDGGGQSQVLYIQDRAVDLGWGNYFRAVREHGLMSDEDYAYWERGQTSKEALLKLQSAWGWITDAGGNLLNQGSDLLAEGAIKVGSGAESATEWLGNTWTDVRSGLANWYNQELPRDIELVTRWFSEMMPRVRGAVDDALRWLGNTWNSIVAWALDPNEKSAPAGGGTNHYVAGDALLTYRIDFENDAKATAPAQYVSIVDDLHTNLDWATFELAEVAFGDQFVTVPAGTRNFSTTKTMSYLGQEMAVEIRAELDLDSGRLQVVFSTIDPATGIPPGVLYGFLPPEDGTGRGQGHVSYRILPKAGLPSGTQISNVAGITFDFTQTIATDQVDPHDPSKGVDSAKQARNTLDATIPVSRVSALPAVSAQPDFTVAWDASDEANGSGISGVDLFVSANGGTWTLWKEKATGNQAVFAGSPGTTYAFYSIAHDYAGHAELAPDVADSSTRVSGSAAPRLAIARNADDSITLTWLSIAGSRYTVQEAPAPGGSWTSVAGQSDLPGTGSGMSSRLTPVGPRFYRLAVTQ